MQFCCRLVTLVTYATAFCRLPVLVGLVTARLRSTPAFACGWFMPVVHAFTVHIRGYNIAVTVGLRALHTFIRRCATLRFAHITAHTRTARSAVYVAAFVRVAVTTFTHTRCVVYVIGYTARAVLLHGYGYGCTRLVTLRTVTTRYYAVTFVALRSAFWLDYRFCVGFLRSAVDSVLHTCHAFCRFCRFVYLRAGCGYHALPHRTRLRLRLFCTQLFCVHTPVYRTVPGYLDTYVLLLYRGYCLVTCHRLHTLPHAHAFTAARFCTVRSPVLITRYARLSVAPRLPATLHHTDIRTAFCLRLHGYTFAVTVSSTFLGSPVAHLRSLRVHLRGWLPHYLRSWLPYTHIWFTVYTVTGCNMPRYTRYTAVTPALPPRSTGCSSGFTHHAVARTFFLLVVQLPLDYVGCYRSLHRLPLVAAAVYTTGLHCTFAVTAFAHVAHATPLRGSRLLVYVYYPVPVYRTAVVYGCCSVRGSLPHTTRVGYRTLRIHGSVRGLVLRLHGYHATPFCHAVLGSPFTLRNTTLWFRSIAGYGSWVLHPTLHYLPFLPPVTGCGFLYRYRAVRTVCLDSGCRVVYTLPVTFYTHGYAYRGYVPCPGLRSGYAHTHYTAPPRVTHTTPHTCTVRLLPFVYIRLVVGWLPVAARCRLQFTTFTVARLVGFYIPVPLRSTVLDYRLHCRVRSAVTYRFWLLHGFLCRFTARFTVIRWFPLPHVWLRLRLRCSAFTVGLPCRLRGCTGYLLRSYTLHTFYHYARSHVPVYVYYVLVVPTHRYFCARFVLVATRVAVAVLLRCAVARVLVAVRLRARLRGLVYRPFTYARLPHTFGWVPHLLICWLPVYTHSYTFTHWLHCRTVLVYTFTHVGLCGFLQFQFPVGLVLPVLFSSQFSYYGSDSVVVQLLVLPSSASSVGSRCHAHFPRTFAVTHTAACTVTHAHAVYGLPRLRTCYLHPRFTFISGCTRSAVLHAGYGCVTPRLYTFTTLRFAFAHAHLPLRARLRCYHFHVRYGYVAFGYGLRLRLRFTRLLHGLHRTRFAVAFILLHVYTRYTRAFTVVVLVTAHYTTFTHVWLPVTRGSTHGYARLVLPVTRLLHAHTFGCAVATFCLAVLVTVATFTAFTFAVAVTVTHRFTFTVTTRTFACGWFTHVLVAVTVGYTRYGLHSRLRVYGYAHRLPHGLPHLRLCSLRLVAVYGFVATAVYTRSTHAVPLHGLHTTYTGLLRLPLRYVWVTHTRGSAVTLPFTHGCYGWFGSLLPFCGYGWLRLPFYTLRLPHTCGYGYARLLPTVTLPLPFVGSLRSRHGCRCRLRWFAVLHTFCVLVTVGLRLPVGCTCVTGWFAVAVVTVTTFCGSSSLRLPRTTVGWLPPYTCYPLPSPYTRFCLPDSSRLQFVTTTFCPVIAVVTAFYVYGCWLPLRLVRGWLRSHVHSSRFCYGSGYVVGYWLFAVAGYRSVTVFVYGLLRLRFAGSAGSCGLHVAPRSRHTRCVTPPHTPRARLHTFGSFARPYGLPADCYAVYAPAVRTAHACTLPAR